MKTEDAGQNQKGLSVALYRHSKLDTIRRDIDAEPRIGARRLFPFQWIFEHISYMVLSKIAV